LSRAPKQSALSQHQEAKQLTARGIKWNLIEQIGVSVLTLAATVVLSRVLIPEDFGLLGMLTVLTNLTTLVINMGLSYSVIQNRALSEEDLSSLFWFNVVVGGLATVSFFFLAPFVADFYNQPGLLDVARVLCLVFVVQGVSAIPLGVIMKRMDFRSHAFSQVSATFLSYASSIFLATAGFGYWALVAQVLVFNTILVSLNLFFSRWRPSLEFSLGALKKIKSFSINFTLTQFIEFGATNLDAVLTGKFIGTRELGFMGRASALAMLPVTSFGFILNRSFFPWFSSLQDQWEELQHRYLQAANALFLVIVPVLMLVGVSSEEVVLLLFGDRWVEAAPMIKVFVIYASFNCFNLFHDSFVTSQGRTDLLIKVNMIEKTVLIMAVLAGLVGYGLYGIIVAKTLTTIVFFFFRLHNACKLVRLSVLTWLASQRRIALSLIISFSFAYSAKTVLSESFFLLKLVLVTGIGLLVFYASLYLLKEPSLSLIKRIVVDQLKIGKDSAA